MAFFANFQLIFIKRTLERRSKQTVQIQILNRGSSSTHTNINCPPPTDANAFHSKWRTATFFSFPTLLTHPATNVNVNVSPGCNVIIMVTHTHCLICKYFELYELEKSDSNNQM